MGLTPFLMRMHQGKISEQDMDIVRERNLKSENDAPYRVPEKFSASIPKRVIKTTYDDRNWTNMDETHSNAKGDYPDCPQSNEEYDELIKKRTDDEIAGMCELAGYDAAPKEVKDAYNKSGSKKKFAEWYKEWKDTEGGQLVLGGIKTGLGSLWDKLFPPKVSTTYVPPVDDKKGISPIGWGLIAVGGVAILMTVLVLLAKGGKTETQAAAQ